LFANDVVAGSQAQIKRLISFMREIMNMEAEADIPSALVAEMDYGLGDHVDRGIGRVRRSAACASVTLWPSVLL
jgi:hypothetical protein